MLTTHPLLVPGLRKWRAIPPLLPKTLLAYSGVVMMMMMIMILLGACKKVVLEVTAVRTRKYCEVKFAFTKKLRGDQVEAMQVTTRHKTCSLPSAT
jgi:hypothetical protein